jgi:OOP family OmpA-OmpF porin
VADNTDKCPLTPWSDAVDGSGCSADPSKIANLNPDGSGVDTDLDGVTDPDDQCPQSPMGAAVDITGCWKIQPVLFAFGHDTISPQYLPALNDVIAVLKKNPALTVEIQGHTDNVGSAEFNRKLSAQRAQAARMYLQDQGIAPDRLNVRSYGATRAQASNDTAAGRALNRRVEMVPNYQDGRRASNFQR